MIVLEKEGLSKSKRVISEIYSDAYEIYRKLRKTKRCLKHLILHLFTELSIHTIRTSFATLPDVVNILFSIEIYLDVRNNMKSGVSWCPEYEKVLYNLYGLLSYVWYALCLYRYE